METAFIDRFSPSTAGCPPISLPSIDPAMPFSMPPAIALSAAASVSMVAAVISKPWAILAATFWLVTGIQRSGGRKFTMSGKRTSRAKFPRSSSNAGVIQLRPPSQPATLGG